jgi:hypothetical protein
LPPDPDASTVPVVLPASALVQLPWVQVWPAPQVIPQPPQFEVVVLSTQASPQKI